MVPSGVMAGSQMANGCRKAVIDNDKYPPQASVPEGIAPYCFNLPVAAGGIAADTSDSITAANTVTAAVQSASMMASTMVSANAMAAAVGLVLPIACSMLSANTTSADLKLTLNVAANLASQGNIVAALSAFSNCACTMISAGNVAADLKGVVRMEAIMSTDGAVITVPAIVAGVWNALAALSNNPGTMGEKLNLAGSGGVDYAALAAAVLAAAQVTPIHSNTKEVNDIEVTGTGEAGDPWGPV